MGPPVPSELEKQGYGKMFMDHVRLKHVSTSYLTVVLPQLPWFQPSNAHTAFQLIRSAEHSNLQGQEPRLARLYKQLPAAWVAPARAGSEAGRQQSAANAGALVLDITREQLVQMHASVSRGEASSAASPCMFYQGYRWKMTLHMPTPRSLYVQLGFKVSKCIAATTTPMLHAQLHVTVENEWLLPA